MPIPPINGPTDQPIESVHSTTPIMGEGVFVEDVTDKIKDQKGLQVRITAIGAVESAIQATIQVAGDLKKMEDHIQSIIGDIMEKMGGNSDVIVRKTTQVSEYITKCTQSDILLSARQLLGKYLTNDVYYFPPDRILSRFYYYHYSSNYNKFSNEEEPLNAMMDALMQDICGVWIVVAAEAINSSKFTMGQNWVVVQEQIAEVIRSITHVQQIILAKRPYTEVTALLAYQLVWLTMNSLTADPQVSCRRETSHVARVKTAFHKMDVKLEQIKKEALALAEALRELPCLGEV